MTRPGRADKDDKELNNIAIAQKGGIDFKRRKNWSERILVEITGLLHVLSPLGDILYCSESTLELTGYRPHELVGQKLMEFLHVDDMDVFIRDFQMSFHIRSQIKTYFRFRKKDDTFVIFEVVGQPSNAGQNSQAFFGIAQPIPAKSGAMIDTFLELKAENDWLKKRVDELSAKYGRVSVDHAEDEAKQQQQVEPAASGLFMNNNLQNGNHQTNGRGVTEDSTGWIEKHASHMEDALYDSKDDILSIEALEKKDKWKRRRKNKGIDEYVCKDCGTTSSPEWRKGPQGPKTLCNACGLRWAKKNKKRNFNED
ncbi:hypothetical protein G6F57_000110 [Rhizopus arrhizus]|uniref:Blue light receptor n=1 Tax=Rhizopus oryzae TaxID=64495 RepID=A0A9P6XKG6_RHIOR|nr:hypothetical protein G6F23_000013 [Rhizopus arrhizus]KAG1428837.1 hypothetical protein G6F58_000374 [Rhizopus delemar]KAG0770496.1 hypothetical protein G6F24_000149 [Rhizopus arrhizus]KAG0797996.1 hypothetical protein G6F21_000087 [Rhizopus arrhizus]KAG0801966.1 hypothetical protein G6F22_000727 [Rhizopus arrhizus]